MPSRRNKSRRVRRRAFQSANKVVVPFVCNITADTSGTKRITAGDLGLDLSRPLKLISLHASYCAVFSSNISWSFLIMMVADGQEGTVSRLQQATSVPKVLHVRQSRIMDFGVYGSNGELAAISYQSPITGTSTATNKPVLCISGKAVVQYKNSATTHVVSISHYDCIDRAGPSSPSSEVLSDFEALTISDRDGTAIASRAGCSLPLRKGSPSGV